jgi:hypothetical protein
MSKTWMEPTSDVDDALSRIVLREDYLSDFESVRTSEVIFPVTMDSALSPPLSESELADIQAAEEEFTCGHIITYENAQDLINALHVARERYKQQTERR